MAQRPTRSLKHEYELFVEQEIENYKESVPRSVLLGIGDDAVSSLSAAPQFALTELLLCDEVDRIIFKRLRLPAYDTWRRRRVKLIDELRRPEHWGLRPDDVLVRALPPSTDGRVLVAGAPDAVSALYLAANGCDVTTLTPGVGRARARHAGGDRRRIGRARPCADRRSVVVDAGGSAQRGHRESVGAGRDVLGRARASHRSLQSATMDGGVHLVQTIPPAGKSNGAVSLEELRSRYRGWKVTVERADGRAKTLLARKGAA